MITERDGHQNRKEVDMEHRLLLDMVMVTRDIRDQGTVMDLAMARKHRRRQVLTGVEGGEKVRVGATLRL